MRKNILGTRTLGAMRHFEKFLGRGLLPYKILLQSQNLELLGREYGNRAKLIAARDIGEKDGRRREIARRRRMRCLWCEWARGRETPRLKTTVHEDTRRILEQCGLRLDCPPPTKAAPRFSHVGIMSDDAAGRRVSSRNSRFPRSFNPAPSSALKTSLLRAAQIFSLTHFPFLIADTTGCIPVSAPTIPLLNKPFTVGKYEFANTKLAFSLTRAASRHEGYRACVEGGITKEEVEMKQGLGHRDTKHREVTANSNSLRIALRSAQSSSLKTSQCLQVPDPGCNVNKNTASRKTSVYATEEAPDRDQQHTGTGAGRDVFSEIASVSTIQLEAEERRQSH
ncbi:hypothetical protein PR048_004864 [Dryococelus australis]|uniref:Uncharacterized protein n=1 Tax=Dryococelus australis TaxID=614101 RepID=A0ABQ9I7N9_9NEOP|nr:hypothetical protein PR048_004864 [Dryococelus australis]